MNLRSRSLQGLLITTAALTQWHCAQASGLDHDFRVADSGAAGAPGNGDGDGDSSTGGTVSEEEPPDLPTGKLVFDRSENYDDWNAKMFVAQLPEGDLTEIDGDYGICSPISGKFDSTGDRLVVVAIPKSDDPCPTNAEDRRSQTELFLLDVSDLGEPTHTPSVGIRLTENNAPDEDPIFSPDGETIYFKHAGHLASMPSSGTTLFRSCEDKPDGAECIGTRENEQSNPVATVDQLFYWGDKSQDNPETNLYWLPLSDPLTVTTDLTLVRNPVVENDVIAFSRPAVFGNFLYYSRWRGSGDQANRIARKGLNALEGGPEDATFALDQDSVDYTDVAGLDLEDDLLVFSTTQGDLGGHNLHVARFNGESTWDLDELTNSNDEINSALDEHWAHFVASPVNE